MPYYFAYGSNMSSLRLRRRVGPLIDHGWAMLHDFAHLFDKRGADGTAKGNVVRRPGSVVHGVLYELEPSQLEKLDRYEGGYARIEIEVNLHAGRIFALTYTAHAAQRAEGLEPARSYLDHYLRGAEEHRLPGEYLERILGDLMPR